MRLLLATALAALLLAPKPAVSCDSSDKTAHKGGCSAACPHAAAATADRGDTKGDVVLAANHEGAAASGKDCPYAKAAAASAHAGCCPFAQKASQQAALADTGRELRATGKVVCARCELKQDTACKSVFQEATSKTTYPLCPQAMTDELLKLTRHGELEVTVHGKVRRADAGDEVLCVDGFSVGTI